MDEKEAAKLQESITTMQTTLATLQESNKALQEERDRLRDGQTLQEARGLVTAQVNASALPDITKGRLIERLALNPPAKEGVLDKDALKTLVETAIKDEVEYLGKLLPSPIRGMGASFSESRDEKAEADLAGTFGRLGLSESAAKVAAGGRN